MPQRAYSQRNLFIVGLAALSWLAIWSLTQGLFMSDFWLFDKVGIASQYYVLAAGIVTAIAIALGWLMAHHLKLISKIFPKNKWLIAYIVVPIVLGIYVFHHGGSPQTFALAALLILSIFWQDFLTFGILQQIVTAYTKKLGWFIVAVVFWIGHVIFYLPAFGENVISWLMFFAAAVLLAFLTSKTKSFYLTDVLHIAFILLI